MLDPEMLDPKRLPRPVLWLLDIAGSLAMLQQQQC